MNEGEIRVRGLEAVREWVSKDDRYISMIGECEIIRDAVDILGRRTIGEGEEGEEGVSVREKNGILGILLEVVEGGGWKGKYEELEEVVGRLEEEGKKGWISKRREKGKNCGREWKEMGRLAHEVGWAIEEKRGREEGREDGSMVTLQGMKKNLEEEKVKLKEKDKQLEEEKMNLQAEKIKIEEEKRKVIEIDRQLQEEKRRREMSDKKTEEETKRADEEKRMKEEEKKRADMHPLHHSNLFLIILLPLLPSPSMATPLHILLLWRS